MAPDFMTAITTTHDKTTTDVTLRTTTSCVKHDFSSETILPLAELDGARSLDGDQLADSRITLDGDQLASTDQSMESGSVGCDTLGLVPHVIEDPGLVVENEVRGTHSPISVQRSRPGRRGRWARRQALGEHLDPEQFHYGQVDTQLDNGYDAWMDHMLGPHLPTGAPTSSSSLQLTTGTSSLVSFALPCLLYTSDAADE